ncbi:hypothetical protein STCU_11518 [Strigomonas culicis]|nr:hypothetical protein STCU_11518 [Strigomonas culicis]|eukprot:EPY16151.1 hypothetical protein STCU_11518 [Strigomonas culicis]
MVALLAQTTETDHPALYHKIRQEYILMRRINFPVVTGVVFRHGEIHVLQQNLCSELGVYGTILSDGRYDASHNAGQQQEQGGSHHHYHNAVAGYIVRSKPADVADGGVMAGVACLDCALLVD